MKKIFGAESQVIYGDWSSDKQMRNFISTPNLGLKRTIASNFTLYDFDEYLSTKLNYKTEEVQENLYLPDKKGRCRKMHPILTYKMEKGRLGCINRDKNAKYNFRKIVQHWFQTGKRPEKYRRGTPKKESKKPKITTTKKRSSSVIKPKKVQLV